MRLMDLKGFLISLGNLPVNKVGSPLKALSDLWTWLKCGLTSLPSLHSQKCCPIELFSVVRALVSQVLKGVDLKNVQADCDSFAKHFVDKITHIRHNLDTLISSVQSQDVIRAQTGPSCMGGVRLVRSDKVETCL